MTTRDALRRAREQERKAAHDLLAACQLVASCAVTWEPLTPGDIRAVTEAIAKATGQSGEGR